MAHALLYSRERFLLLRPFAPVVKMNQTRRFLIALVFVLGARPAQAQVAARQPDWDALAMEAQRILVNYIRINTTNPPGNELAAAKFLKKILDSEGIEATILDTAELGPGRANLYARLKGNGSKRAVALVHHMDVVPVAREHWSVDPFAGTIKDGYLYGRGTLDMKGSG